MDRSSDSEDSLPEERSRGATQPRDAGEDVAAPVRQGGAPAGKGGAPAGEGGAAAAPAGEGGAHQDLTNPFSQLSLNGKTHTLAGSRVEVPKKDYDELWKETLPGLYAQKLAPLVFTKDVP